MIELRKLFIKELRKYNDRVYFQRAPKGATYPYVVFDFLPSFTNDEQEVLPMDVDVWDVGGNTVPIETIASNIWRGLRKFNYIDELVQVSVDRDTRFPDLDEDEVDIKRRKLTFEVRYFDRLL